MSRSDSRGHCGNIPRGRVPLEDPDVADSDSTARRSSSGVRSAPRRASCSQAWNASSSQGKQRLLDPFPASCWTAVLPRQAGTPPPAPATLASGLDQASTGSRSRPLPPDTVLHSGREKRPPSLWLDDAWSLRTPGEGRCRRGCDFSSLYSWQVGETISLGMEHSSRKGMQQGAPGAGRWEEASVSQGQAREKELSESGEAVLAENRRGSGRGEPGWLQSPGDPARRGGPRLTPVACACYALWLREIQVARRSQIAKPLT